MVMTNFEDARPDDEDVDEDRRDALRLSLLLPYVVPAITSIAIMSSSTYGQPPSVVNNDVPPPVNEDDPPPVNEDDPPPTN